MAKKGKLRVGWFSFACSEDSTIMMTEVLNECWQEWKKKIDIAYARVLQSQNEINDLDVAFIEGAITTNEDAKRAKEIRKNSKYVVAIGSCAVTGMPSAQRNLFDANLKKEIKPLLIKFKHREKVLALKDVIKVDDNVPGCPMNEKIFLEVLDKYLKKFGV
ncbi:Sulfhydrogenase 1 subunit delta [uncultured archaeon]|nr:Sulfhydrogenase 1 subunit delta [uncultured archaeon]